MPLWSTRRIVCFVMLQAVSLATLHADVHLSRLIRRSRTVTSFVQRNFSSWPRNLSPAFLARSCSCKGMTSMHPTVFATRFDARNFHFWLSMRGGTAQGPDPGTIDISMDRKPIPPLMNSYEVSVCSVKGLRSFMEDEFVTTGDFCAVFDGHGGDAVSRYLRQNLYGFMQAALPSAYSTNHGTSSARSNNTTKPDTVEPLLVNRSELNVHQRDDSSNLDLAKSLPTVEDYVVATHSAFAAVDARVQRILHWSFQGSTATGVWIHDDGNGTQHIITGHVGDSRAVLSRRGGEQILELSRDHKPDLEEERARIEAVGGAVVWCGRVDREGRPVPGTGLYRVNGNLALSRAIGDRSERPAVCAIPDISVQALSSCDDFLVVASDGLWDVMTTVDVVGFVHALIEEDDGELMTDPDLVAAKLVEEALRRGTYDNVTVIIVWLGNTLNPSRAAD